MKKRKYKIFILISLVLIVSASGYYAYRYFAKKQTNTKPIVKQPKPPITIKSKFPKLESNYFNSFIKTNNFNTNYIDDEIALAIVQDIATRINAANGSLYFDYKIINKQEIHIFFKWQYNDEIEEKQYQVLLKS
ncbi:hypothetical protein GE118_02805 [Mycoplasma sp. NEAQ87857]|uniref:MHO_1590 family protein n=1 Tax=Mycoplasma sp. NEAQ87857 TaxID=2683967 RepID=UPI0013181DE9|nr:hypothetical protein [Mycoplasma sp. NEAQ87857]QGZ97723.1 hypothetical protein GE118_02805 [Mycoplasma sp. NEAQ87857]